LHELGLFNASNPNGVRGKTNVSPDVEHAVAVILVERIVLFGEFTLIGPPHSSGERSPRLIGVNGDQCVIKIKESQLGIVQGFHSQRLKKYGLKGKNPGTLKCP